QQDEPLAATAAQQGTEPIRHLRGRRLRLIVAHKWCPCASGFVASDDRFCSRGSLGTTISGCHAGLNGEIPSIAHRPVSGDPASAYFRRVAARGRVGSDRILAGERYTVRHGEHAYLDAVV